MSNLVLNIRVLYWHLQISKKRKVRFSFNHYLWRDGIGWKLFSIYEFDVVGIIRGRE